MRAAESLPRLSTAALAATLQLPKTYIFANDLWAQLPDSERELAHGRRQRFVRDAEGQVVCTDRWLFSDGTDAVEATASYAVEQSVGMRPLFEHMVAGLRRREPVPEAPADPGVGAVAPAEPRLDSQATGLFGEPVEDVVPLREAQPYRVSGTVLTRAAGELFLSMSKRDRLGPFDRSGNRPAVAELVEAGLLTDAGRLTPEGVAYLAPIRAGASVVDVHAVGGAVSTGVRAWLGGGAALVWAGPSPALSGEPPQDRFELRLGAAAALPGELAGWAGLAPSWSLTDEPVLMSEESFGRRVSGTREPVPAGVPSSLWSAPWTAWNFGLNATGQLSVLNAGSAGYFRITASEGTIRLVPEQAGDVWDLLLEIIHRAVEGSWR
ncbi:hypothetical protein ACWGQ2_04295 [Arthrobacter sp. NPDC055585]